MLRREFTKLLSVIPFFTIPKVTANCIKADTLVLMNIKNIYKQRQYLKIVFQYKPRIECITTNTHQFLTVRNGQSIGYVKTDELIKNDKVWIQIKDIYSRKNL